MKKKILSLVSVLCIFNPFASNSAKAGHHSEKNKITLVADEWCPYTCAETEEKQGILIDIAKEAFSRHGIEVEYKLVPWSRAIADTRAGKYTAIVGASPDEAPDFIYPALQQATSHLVFYTLSDSKWVYNYRDNNNSFDSVSFGAVADYSYNREIDWYIKKHKENPAKVQLVYGDNALEMNMQKLLSKRIDAVLDEDLVIRRYIKEHDLSDQVRFAGALPEDITNFLFISFSPHEKEAKQYAWILDQEMLDMIYSGKVAEIINEYKSK